MQDHETGLAVSMGQYAGAFEIRVLPFDCAVACRPGQTLLAAVLNNRKFIRYGCKNGGCGSCKLRVVEGDVEQRGAPFGLTDADRAEGWVLACTTAPQSDCAIDVGAMELSVDEFEAGDSVGTYLCEVESRLALTDDIRVLRLRVPDGSGFKFIAGQFVNVEVPGLGEFRSFSMANPPSDSACIELIVRLLPGGRFSEHLESRLQVGDRVRVQGPYGQLKIRLSHRPMVALAGGSGMAPILSMLTDLAEKGNRREFTFFFGARRYRDLYFVDRLRELEQRMPSLHVVYSVLEDAPREWSGETGNVTDALARRMQSLEGFDAYLCGPPGMIDAARELVLQRGVRPRNIYLDAFVPTGGAPLT